MRNEDKPLKGILYGVGVGPGDPELLTLKAVDVIRRCDVIATPDAGGDEQLALQIAGAYIQDQEILLCRLPMTRDKEVLTRHWRQAADDIAEKLDQGLNVAFLTLGDPSVYATYSYIHRLVVNAGYETVMIPGITSFCAAAAALGTPLCVGDQQLHILPAASKTLGGDLDAEGTKVLMKLGRKRDEVLDLLEQKDLLDRSAMVERCTMADEQVTQNLRNLASDNGYFSVVIVKEGER